MTYPVKSRSSYDLDGYPFSFLKRLVRWLLHSCPTPGNCCGSLIILVLFWSFPSLSGAHAVLVESIPPHAGLLKDYPPTITLRFNATLEKGMTRVHLVDIHESTVDVDIRDDSSSHEIVVNVPPLSPGVYSFVFKVLARDGHVTEGSIRFTILHP